MRLAAIMQPLGRVLLLLSLVGTLAGCGPSSLRTLIAQRPHITWFAKTSPLTDAAPKLVAPTTTLFSSQKTVTSAPVDDLLLPRLSPDPAMASGLSRWRELDSVVQTFSLSTPAAGANGATSLLQVQIARFASTDDAAGWYRDALSLGPAYPQSERQSDPHLGARSAAYRAALMGGFTGDLIYVQERNIVLRVVSIVPNSAQPGVLAKAAAKRESAWINAAP